ncbi:hypothetical protein ACFSC4_27480 [Deinococcus malanensis]|uniref:hypothetical protein n=1 Tax=Deinococcus malanensis TaxID=1706855 RepID=UPI003643B58E
MDSFAIKTHPGEGTEVLIGVLLPPGTSLAAHKLGSLTDALIRDVPSGPLEEVRAQNQELLRTMAELSTREEQLQVLNQELEDTNRESSRCTAIWKVKRSSYAKPITSSPCSSRI